MDTGIAIKISYWAEADSSGEASIHDLSGINEFREDLARNYISVVHGRPGDLGGLHELAIELVANISLMDVAKFLAGGIAYDLIKSGSKAFVLRPFLQAYEELRERNPSNDVDIEELRIVFQDSVVVIYKICENGIFSQLEGVLQTLGRHYDKLLLSSGERPFEIHVPVLEDLAEDRLIRFRVILDVDETISGITLKNYLDFWGLWYDYSRKFRVYDVARALLIDEQFYTRDRYWYEWEQRRKRATGSGL